MVKAPNVTHAKRLRALLDSHADRQKKHEARLDLRKRIRDHGIATTARMDRERLRDVRADVPSTARTALDMRIPRTSTPPRGPMRVDLTPSARGSSVRPASSGSVMSARSIARSIARSSSAPMSSGSAMSVGSRPGSVGSLVAQFEGLGHPGGVAPARRPARMERDLSRYKRKR
jgi:hypothetical protein